MTTFEIIIFIFGLILVWGFLVFVTEFIKQILNYKFDISRSFENHRLKTDPLLKFFDGICELKINPESFKEFSIKGADETKFFITIRKETFEKLKEKK